MEDIKNLISEDDAPWIITLTDDETGEDQDFEVIAQGPVDGKTYFVLNPVNAKEEEYVIFEYREEGEEIILETIEDDEVYEKVEDFFNDLLFSEADYDEN